MIREGHLFCVCFTGNEKFERILKFLEFRDLHIIAAYVGIPTLSLILAMDLNLKRHTNEVCYRQ